MVSRRNDYLLRIDEHLAVRNQSRTEENVRDMFLFDLQLHEFDRSIEMNQLIAVEIFTFDREEDVAIVRLGNEHDGSFLAGAEGVFIDNDFNAAVAIAD